MLRRNALATVYGSVTLWDLPKSVVLSELKFGEHSLSCFRRQFSLHSSAEPDPLIIIRTYTEPAGIRYVRRKSLPSRQACLEPDPLGLAESTWSPVFQADSLRSACMLAQHFLLALAATRPGTAAC